jgi:hypothetical protein
VCLWVRGFDWGRNGLGAAIGPILPSPPGARAHVFSSPTPHPNNEQKWNKAHSVTHMKANPLGGAAMAKGIVLEKM